MKNTKTEMKNTLEGINSKLNDTENWSSKLEDRVAEITDAEKKKKKEWEEMRTAEETSETTSSVLIFVL